MKQKIHIPLLGLAALATSAVTANAAVILSDDFESGSGNWTTSVASYYVASAPATAETIQGNGVIALDTEQNGTPLTLTTPLQLATLGATQVSIYYDGQWGDVAGTRFFNVEYSANGGTNWTSLQQLSGTGAGTGVYSNTLTVTAPAAMTDQFLFRFRPKDDGSSGSDYRFFLDNTTITHNGIPEPTTALLGTLGFLAFLRRRR